MEHAAKIPQEQIDVMEEGSQAREGAERTNQLIDAHLKQQNPDEVDPPKPEEGTPEEAIKPEGEPPKIEPEIKIEEKKTETKPVNKLEDWKYWKQKNSTLEGIHKSYKAKVNEQFGAMSAEIDALKSQLSGVQTQTNKTKTVEPTQTAPINISPDAMKQLDNAGYSQTDVQAFVNILTPAITQEIEGRLKPALKQTDVAVEQMQKNQANATFIAYETKFNQIVPNRAEIEAHPLFDDYMNSNMPLTNISWQKRLNQAVDESDLKTGKQIYDGFMATQAEPQTEISPSAPAPEAHKPVVDPARGMAAQPKAAGKGRIYTRAEIATVTKQITKLQSNPATKDAGDKLYDDLRRANVEGRITN